MKTIPVYFPMTYLSASVESMLAACFRQTAVYRPSDRKLPEAMQAAVGPGRLVVRTPVEKESERLLGLIDEYYSWAEVNKGGDLSFFKGNESSIPFFDGTSTSRIRQNIRDIGDGGEKEEPADPVFEARLFLEMAQELDRQNNELERSLDDLSVKENSMLEELLRGDQDHRNIEPVKRPGSAADPGAYMTANRIRAWWKLAREGSEACNLLVTESRAVIEYLIENGPGMEQTGLSGRLPLRQAADRDLPAWQDRFLEYLQRLVFKSNAGAGAPATPAVKPGEAAVQVSLYRFEGGGADAFFNSLNKPAAGMADHIPGENLVICLVGY